MKITNGQIINFLNAGVGNKQLPIKLAYAIAVNIEAVKPALEAYNKKREELIGKYAEKDEMSKPATENGNYIFEDAEGWNKAITELINAEAEVTVTKIPVHVLEKCDEPGFDNLSVGDIATINFMIGEYAE